MLNMFGVQGSFNACTKWDLMYTWFIKQGYNTYNFKKWTMEYWMSFGMLLPFFKFITKYLHILKIFFNNPIHTTNEEVLGECSTWVCQVATDVIENSKW